MLPYFYFLPLLELILLLELQVLLFCEIEFGVKDWKYEFIPVSYVNKPSYFALPLFGKRFSHNDPINGIKNEYLVITDMAGIEGRYRTQI